MSKPRYPWWQYIKNVIRAYPELKQEYDALHEQNVTAQISGMPGSGSVSRGTEEVALRCLTPPKQARYEAVSRAIQVTQSMKTGKDRMKLISLVFWTKTLTLSGAAYAINVSYDTAINYHGDFIMLVAFFKGEITYDELNNSQKFALKSQKDVI